MARVLLQNLTKVFADGTTAVDHLDLDVADGELLAIVGPSGCGKTTALRLIAGLEDVTAGSVHFDGRDVTRLAPWHRGVAMVFQDAALYPHLQVSGNLSFALRLRRTPREQIARRVDQVAQWLQISDLLGRKPHELSGGQQRRVALARALVVDAQVYLLDEPLSQLDASARRELRQCIGQLHRRTGCTMIYVTHDQEEAMSVGDRIAVLRGGVLQQCADPMTVYGRPANRFVAGFIGSAPMNLLSGTLAQRSGTWEFDDGHLRLALPESTGARFEPGPPQTVVLGFRPEALRPCGAAALGETACAVQLKIESVQPLGDRMDLRLATGGPTSVLARVPAAAQLSAGQPAVFALDAAELHFFAADEEGRSLLPVDGTL